MTYILFNLIEYKNYFLRENFYNEIWKMEFKYSIF